MEKSMFINPEYCMGNRTLWEKGKVAFNILQNPWMLVLDKLGLVKNPIYKTRTGFLVATRGKTTDVNDVVVVMSGREYPTGVLGLSESSSVVVDAGGHIGSFALYIKSIQKNAKIFILEPVEDNLKLLRHNLSINKINDVTIIPKALYGKSGMFSFDAKGKSMDAGSLSEDVTSESDSLQVEAVTLSELFRSNGIEMVDLLKLDIEGGEYNVVELSMAELSSRVKRVIMEFHPAGDKIKRDFLVEHFALGDFVLIYETKNILGFANQRYL